MKLRRVVVTWNDAYGDAMQQVWAGDELNHRPVVVQSVGFLIREDEIGVTIFQDYIDDSGEPAFRGKQFIPRGMVISVQTLQASRTKKNRAISES